MAGVKFPTENLKALATSNAKAPLLSAGELQALQKALGDGTATFGEITRATRLVDEVLAQRLGTPMTHAMDFSHPRAEAAILQDIAKSRGVDVTDLPESTPTAIRDLRNDLGWLHEDLRRARAQTSTVKTGKALKRAGEIALGLALSPVLVLPLGFRGLQLDHYFERPRPQNTREVANAAAAKTIATVTTTAGTFGPREMDALRSKLAAGTLHKPDVDQATSWVSQVIDQLQAGVPSSVQLPTRGQAALDEARNVLHAMKRELEALQNATPEARHAERRKASLVLAGKVALSPVAALFVGAQMILGSLFRSDR
jgi:hypothetical protein